MKPATHETEIDGQVYHKKAAEAAAVERRAFNEPDARTGHILFAQAAKLWKIAAVNSRRGGETYADKRFDFCVKLLQRAARSDLVNQLA